MSEPDVPPRGLVLVVDDDPPAARALVSTLSAAGFRARVERHAAAAAAAGDVHPDLVVVRLVPHRPTDLDTCRTLLRVAGAPLVVLGQSSDELDVVVALELGADDYLTEPHRPRELVARMDAVLRRRRVVAPTAPSRWRAGDIEVDVAEHVVIVRGERVHLAVKEFRLLAVLIASTNRVVRRRDLIAAAWTDPAGPDRKALDVHIKRLRASIELDPHRPAQLLTVRGVGYKLTDGQAKR
jgi:two-component system response regulator RegX3